MFLTDGLLAKKKEIEMKLEFYLYDGDEKYRAAYISDLDGTLHIWDDKLDTKEDCIAVCEWYLKTVKEL